MLLTFIKPKFEGLIKENIKQHTIRADKNNRWKVGNSIQFWMGNPRNVRAKNKPYQFGTGVCSRIEKIEFRWWKTENEKLYPNSFDDVENEKYCDVYLNDEVLKIEEVQALAINDGFEDSIEFFKFFNENFVGKLIFWNKTIWIKNIKKMKVLQENKSHIFINTNYNLSTDYKNLWDLIQNGKKIAAWLVYTDEYEEPIWDLVEVKNIWGKPNDYTIGTRGICYDGPKEFEWFESICKKYSLHYVCPNNQ